MRLPCLDNVVPTVLGNQQDIANYNTKHIFL